MLKTVEEVSPTKKKLGIEIPSEAIEKEIAEELQRLRQRMRLPGFRAGKAPLPLIEKKFGKDVEGEVLQKLIPKYYAESMSEAALKPVGNPVFEHADQFRRNTPFGMTILVEVMPTVENLSYEGIEVRDMETTAEEKEVDEVLGRLREDKAKFEPSEEPLAAGDVAVVDYEVKEEGKCFEAQVVKVGGPAVPEEFSKALVNRKKGDAFDAKVKFPEDHPAKEAAGRELTFHITLKDTKKVKLPAMDDEFARDLGRESLDGLRAHVKEEILKSKRNTVRKMQKAEIMKKLVEAHDFEVPESLLDEELKGMAGEAAAAGETAEPGELMEKNRDSAVRNVKASILLELIGEKEKVAVTEDDVKARIAEMSMRSGLPPENIVKYYVTRHGSLDSLRHAVFEEKVMDLLIEKARPEKEDK
jgi:trigger factor